ncbi:DUF362 domain-containing protein [Methanohalophilus portucalensis]|uniref:DUF362 domain-containing protein n=2 Tax=Methanohalophilus portucalensis TaxID=39664 RepID=A0A1L9C3B0_9EURY|nr:DUF362 domain-containing protein [Methanohalophilus portucalensis]ATU07496.1 (Fe-S)-binding protein [Methanohalophilus portucalensis]OJH49034.1 hypothetical protein MPF_1536 [Methanohalophilus portucalensis FDF-1]RNI10227.1 DUF362 domain-containing protein [Methanohalophilus portucalensis FDF-1]SMH38772.1 Uncharacterized conserved protein, DUF362 family [Methanohalophilus portucalensis FDF-1]
MSHNRVALVRCVDYSASKQAVWEAMDLLGCFDEIKAGMRILIKPNVLAARKPEDAATTHPSLVRAVCEIVKEAGAHPVVGDCAGITSAGATAEALEESGIKQAALEGGSEVVNFQTAGFSKVKPENPLRLDEIYVSDSVLDADYIINLPKLKTHELTTMTGAVKNIFGAVPLRIRKEAHMLADPLIFSEVLLDIYNVVTPQLSLIDAVVGMEGDGPSRGKPINVGAILASKDGISLDMVAAQLMDLAPLSIPTNLVATRVYGDISPQIVGVNVDDIAVPFKKPGPSLLRMLPSRVVQKAGGFFTVRPEIDANKCTACGACVLNCPAEAIHMDKGHAVIDDKKCILCYCCRELCPAAAVKSKKSLLARLL